MENKPYWINITGRNKGLKYRCSSCNNDCICIHYGAFKKRTYCNYKYCPNCGAEMNLNFRTLINIKYEEVEYEI